MAKFVVPALLALLAALATSVVVKRDPFIRLIPADVLRDYRDGCFAVTQCKVFRPNETWELKPYCGVSKCVAKKTMEDKLALAEEVTDCGPIIDVEKSVGCRLLMDEFDVKDAFPNCCPVYDCEENAEIAFKSKIAKQTTTQQEESSQSSN